MRKLIIALALFHLGVGAQQSSTRPTQSEASPEFKILLNGEAVERMPDGAFRSKDGTIVWMAVPATRPSRGPVASGGVLNFFFKADPSGTDIEAKHIAAATRPRDPVTRATGPSTAPTPTSRPTP